MSPVGSGRGCYRLYIILTTTMTYVPISLYLGWCNIESSGDSAVASPQATGAVQSANPVLEICVACQDLAIDKDDRHPNPVVVIGTQTPPSTDWVRQGQSEIQVTIIPSDQIHIFHVFVEENISYLPRQVHL